MGVLGLWEILESVGHPVKVEGLEGKVLGVDANIWLYKFIRGFRDKDNVASIDSHKLGLFNRISKLLFYRIKPVFVFDGPAPVLKRRTLERRQNIRNKTLSKVQDAAMRAIANQIKSQYPNADVDHLRITLPELRSNNLVAAEKLGEEDFNLFYLPPESESKKEEEESDIDSDYELVGDKQYSTKIDVNSKDFEQLPAEMRYEILQDVKATRKKIRNIESLPEDADSFSNFQLERLRARRKIQEKIEVCEKDICMNYTGELADGRSIQAFRVQSDANSTILYRNNTYDPRGTTSPKKEVDDVKTEVTETKADEPKPTTHPMVAANPATSHINSDRIDRHREEAIDLFLLSPESKKSKNEDEICLNEDDDNDDDDDNIDNIEIETKSDTDSEIDIVDTRSPTKPCTSSGESDKLSTILPEEEDLNPTYMSSESETEEVKESKSDGTIPPVSQRLSTEVELSETIANVSDPAVNRTVEISSDESTIDLDEETGNSTKIPDETNTSDKPVAERPKPTEITNPPTSTSEENDSVRNETAEVERVARSQLAPPLNIPINRDNYNSEVANAQRTTNKVTGKIIEDAKELLRLFGIPYIDAAGEAEAQCAKLEELNLTAGTITDDSDIWLFGAQNVYRYFFSDDKYVMQYKMTDIEYHIRMTRDNLVCFAMLVGSDYTDGIMNVGPVTALEILSEFPGDGMEPLIKYAEWHKRALRDKKKIGEKKRKKLLKYNLPEEFPSRAVFDGYLRPCADSSTESFTWGTPELDELREYARRNFGWDQKKVDEKLLPVMKKLNEKKIQKTIDSFFFKTQANRNPEMFRSKRVNQALNKIAKRAALGETKPLDETVNLSDDDD